MTWHKLQTTFVKLAAGLDFYIGPLAWGQWLQFQTSKLKTRPDRTGFEDKSGGLVLFLSI